METDKIIVLVTIAATFMSIVMVGGFVASLWRRRSYAQNGTVLLRLLTVALALILAFGSATFYVAKFNQFEDALNSVSTTHSSRFSRMLDRIEIGGVIAVVLPPILFAIHLLPIVGDISRKLSKKKHALDKRFWGQT